MSGVSEILDNVKDYYGKQVQKTADLKTQACISTGITGSADIKAAIALVHDDITNKYYGCGLVIPEVLEGMNVLDLGSGSGRDCFAISKLVGQNGHVTGLDMTEEQLAVANKYIQYHTDTFGYTTPNVKFVKGYIEKLTEAGIEAGSIDIIISNCVVNLSPDKQAVLSEAYKTLKVGGELYFSDIYADRIVSDDIKKHQVLWGEGFSGALWWETLYQLAEEIGFSAPRLVTAAPINVDREDFKRMIGDTKYVSATYRLFKLPKQRASPTQVIYKGKIAGFECALDFDHQTRFVKGEVNDTDSEMATIIQSSRFKEHFDFLPTKSSEKTDLSTRVDPFQYIKH